MYMSLFKGLLHAFTFIALIVIFQAVMNFLGVEVSSYLVFLAWFVGLILFYYLLPSDYKLFNFK